MVRANGPKAALSRSVRNAACLGPKAYHYGEIFRTLEVLYIDWHAIYMTDIAATFLEYERIAI